MITIPVIPPINPSDSNTRSSGKIKLPFPNVVVKVVQMWLCECGIYSYRAQHYCQFDFIRSEVPPSVSSTTAEKVLSRSPMTPTLSSLFFLHQVCIQSCFVFVCFFGFYQNASTLYFKKLQSFENKLPEKLFHIKAFLGG